MKLYSVTEVLAPWSAYGFCSEEVLALAAERGSAVHRASASYAQGLMPVIKKEWFGYFVSFRKWFDEYVDRVIFVEEHMIDPDLGYHGHPDLGVRLKPVFDIEVPVIDLKTPLAAYPTWKAQTGAYLHLAHHEYPDEGFDSTMSLQLDPGGRVAKANIYKTPPQDFAGFLSALNAYRYFNS